MIRDSRRLLILFLFFSVAATLLVSTTSAQDAKNIFIDEDIDISEFPDVGINIRAVDGDNQIVPNLVSDDIVLYENEKTVSNFELGTAEYGPVYVVFVLDRGKWSNFSGAMDDTVRDSMRQFMDGYFRDGIDTVAIMAQTNNEIDGTDTLLAPTQSMATFSRKVNELDLQQSANQTHGLSGVDTALNLLSDLSDPGYAGTAVIYIGKLIEMPPNSEAVPQARTLAAESREQFTKLYSFHTETSANIEYEEPLQTFSTGSGGEYIQLSLSQDNNGNLNRVYQAIMDQGVRYPLSYRSELGDSGTRTVVAAPFGTPAELATHPQSYNITLKPPDVEIQDANNESEVMREVIYDDDGGWAYAPNSITVVANLLDWPDGHDRDVESAIFTVGGEDQTPITNPSGNSFSQHVDISDITNAKAIVVKVTVLDELGIEAESNSFTINVDAEPMPTPPPQFTPTPTPTPSACEIDSKSMPCVTAVVIDYAPWIIVGLLFLTIIVMGVFFWIKLGSLGAVAGVAGGAISDGRKRLVEVGKTMLGGGGRSSGTVLAKLHVSVARGDLEGREVKIYTNRTTIGRDPRLCDVLLYNEDEVSSISGVHCTIQYDMGNFLITDDNSSNGTEVNGEALLANNPRRLNDGDEIVLGDIFHRGAKFRFEIMEEASQFEQEANEPSDAEPLNNEEVYGGKTILDMGDSDDNHDTFYSDGFDDFADDAPNNETDWLGDLE